MFVSQEESGTDNSAAESLDYSSEWSGDSAHEMNRTVNRLVELLALTEPE